MIVRKTNLTNRKRRGNGMACPTCDHTVHKVGVMPEPHSRCPLFWCPRCGTLKANIVIQEHERPKLVSRAVLLALLLRDRNPEALEDLRRLGIIESVSSKSGEWIDLDTSQETG